MESFLRIDPAIIGAVILGALGLIGVIGAALIARRGRGEEQSESQVIIHEVEKAPEPPLTERVIPKPSEPYFVHPYPLQEHFTGRVQERQMLTEWLAEDQRPVLALLAIGGMGKSSLAWVWAKRDVAGLEVPGLPDDLQQVQLAVRLPEGHKLEGLLWWSFYEGGGTFHGFLEAAMAYCSSGMKTAQDYVTEVGREEPSVDYAAIQAGLVQLLQQRRFLLIWDGAERLLREYGGLDASIREERDVEEFDPNARDTIEPAVDRFLREVAGQTSSRLLLTSRLYPRVLEGLAGAEKKELTGLGKDYAEAYLRARGIRGNRSDLISAARQYDFHPLSLTNLAADLLEDFEQKGDISAAPNYDETETLKNRREHILKRAYERRAPHRQELVSRLAAMRGSIPKEVVSLLAEDIEGLRLETMGRDVGELVRHGLLRHPSPELYDFHPVVRRYCYQRLEENQRVHRRLMEYFNERVAEVDEVTSLEDLAPAIEFYHHTVRAGRYDEAQQLFRDRLDDQLFFRFGAYQTIIELLRALFPDGEDHPPRLKEEDAQGWTLNSLANSYALSGQSRRSVPLFEGIVEMSKRGIEEPGIYKVGDWKRNLATALENLALGQIRLGEPAAAEENLRLDIELAEEIGDEFYQATGHQQLGLLLATQGAFDEAARELDAALASFSKLGATQSEHIVWAYRALRALLMRDANAALEAARRARELADMLSNERDIIRSEWLLGAALVALASEERNRQNEHLAEAEGHLTEALTRCRKINLVELEPDILLAWARWHHAKGDVQKAHKDAKEALSISERSEYRLNQADIHNFLARLALDAGDGESAQAHAQTALERAECDGEPHWYKPALDEAESLLREVEGL